MTGELAYHIEFIGLLADCCLGICAGSEAIVRDLLSFTDILDNLLRKELPLCDTGGIQTHPPTALQT